MKNSLNVLLLTAALSGLVSGTAMASAQPSTSGANRVSASRSAAAGLRYTGFDQDKGKHSCKGKNDCKGQGGGKTSDQGCKAKNSCKGKGGCATDGSKPPSLA